MGRRLVAQLAVVVAIAFATFFAFGARSDHRSEPRLRFVQDVPADVRDETDATFTRFLRSFVGRASCVDDVSIELVRSVDDGDARYVTGERRIEIQIPTTPRRYRESLAHELAHHLERTCGEFGSLQVALQPLLGGHDIAWSVGPTWHETPSERFAEAVVELVNGERIRHVDVMSVDPATLEIIARWGTGAQLGADR